MSHSTITILGTGYLGLTTAAVLANADITVYAVEPNPDRLAAIKEGRSFFYEEGLDKLIAAGLEKGTLIPTDSYGESVPNSDVVLSCVGTPDNPDGSSNLSYVFAAAEEAAKYLKPETIFAQKSTVPVGTGRKVMQLFADKSVKSPYISNPEFLSEGSSVYDTLTYDRLIFGGEDQAAIQKVSDIFKRAETQAETTAQFAGLPFAPRTNRHLVVSLESAELIKVTANSILALKISYANSIAKLADKAGADVVEVMDGVGADQRIGRAFLNAGRGYGGGCFPKDVSGLIATGLDYGVDLEIMQAAQAINESMPGYIIDKLQTALGGSVQGKKVAVLGLAFKANTSDTRRSPGIAMANMLAKNGAAVSVYDPQAGNEAKSDLKQGITLSDSIENAVKDTDALLIATDWSEFKDYDLAKLAQAMQGNLVVDSMNCLDPQKVKAAGLSYIGVGR
jgi:UDPglucose 6-dehydrogenase